MSTGFQLCYIENETMQSKEVSISFDENNFIIKEQQKIVKSIDLKDIYYITPYKKEQPGFLIICKNDNVIFLCKTEDERDEIIARLFSSIMPPPREELTNKDVTKLKRVDFGESIFDKYYLVEHNYTKEKFIMSSIRKSYNIYENSIIFDRSVENKDFILSIRHPFLFSPDYINDTTTQIDIFTKYETCDILYNQINREKGLPMSTVKFYTAQLCEAIGFLHSIGIIHGNLNSRNIFIDEKGNIRVAGFGLNEKLHKTLVNEKKLKESYELLSEDDIGHLFDCLAPEAFDNDEYSPAIDWWSLGIVVYEMVYAKNPFYHSNLLDMILKILLDDPVMDYENIENVDNAFINCLLQKDPNERIGTDGDVEIVESHPFFRNFDFVALRKGQLVNELKPDEKNKNIFANLGIDITRHKNIPPAFKGTEPEV